MTHYTINRQTPGPLFHHKNAVYWFPPGKTVADGYIGVASVTEQDDLDLRDSNARLLAVNRLTRRPRNTGRLKGTSAMLSTESEVAIFRNERNESEMLIVRKSNLGDPYQDCVKFDLLSDGRGVTVRLMPMEARDLHAFLGRLISSGMRG